MLKFYKTIDGHIQRLKQEEPGCWVMAVHPTEQELQYMQMSMNLDRDFLSASLDEEEMSRTEKEEDQTFIVVDVPYQVEQDDEKDDEESTVDQYLSNLAVEVGAKTGSAQVSADENANAVFVLFAPYDDPEIVISMVVEGGASGANLASAAGEIVNYYFGSEHTMESIGTENTLIR